MKKLKKRPMMNYQAEHVFPRATNRGFVLEDTSGGYIKTIVLTDLLPEMAKGKTGRFKIVVEYEELDPIGG